MKQEYKLGICMDHSNAHLMEFTTDTIETKIVESKFTHQAKIASLNKGESFMHNKEQHQQAEYYKSLAEVIGQYDEVLLFGPTEAKVELYNLFKDDHLFSNIKVRIIQTDKMTSNEEHAFVKAHFLKHVL